jgi:hypothetical protein
MGTKELVSPANFIVTSQPKKIIIAKIVKKCPVFYGNEFTYNVPVNIDEFYPGETESSSFLHTLLI